MNDGRVGASLVLDDRTERGFRLTDNTSICSAELTAIHESIRLAEERGIEHMTIFSDSIGALRSIQDGSAADRPALLDIIYSALKTIQDRGLILDMCWIPSHVGLVGNKRADLLAKAVVRNQNTELVIKPELTELKERVDDFILSKWQSRWREEKTGRQYFDLEPRVSNQAKYDHKRRQQEVTITRLRPRKCLLNYYLFKMKRHRNGLCDTCGVDETVEHFVMNCGNNKERIRNLKNACIKQKTLFQLNRILSNNSLCDIIHSFITHIKRKL